MGRSPTWWCSWSARSPSPRSTRRTRRRPRGRSRTTCATPPTRSCPPTSSARPGRASSTPRSPWSTVTRSRSSAGTTTSSATPTGWPTSPSWSARACDERRPPFPRRFLLRNGISAPMRRAEDLDVRGQTVLVRADLNVPLENGAISDDGRIRASLPTIRDLLARGAAVVVCAHFGRPTGDDYAARAAGGPSLRPVADRLAELLGQPVTLADDVAGESARVIAETMGAGEGAVCENVPVEPAETRKGDEVR